MKAFILLAVESLEKNHGAAAPSDTVLTFAKSRYVLGWFIPKGEDTVKEGKYICLGEDYAPEVHQQFARDYSCPGNNFKNSFMFVPDKRD